MKYWRDCEICNGKGYTKQEPVELTGANQTIVATMVSHTCPDCVNGKVDASAEIQALLDAQAARIEWLEGKLEEILDLSNESIIEAIAQDALKEAE